jgi:hypothetical protein
MGVVKPLDCIRHPQLLLVVVDELIFGFWSYQKGRRGMTNVENIRVGCAELRILVRPEVKMVRPKVQMVRPAAQMVRPKAILVRLKVALVRASSFLNHLVSSISTSIPSWAATPATPATPLQISPVFWPKSFSYIWLRAILDPEKTDANVAGCSGSRNAKVRKLP